MQKFKRYQKELQVNIEMWEYREHKTKAFPWRQKKNIIKIELQRELRGKDLKLWM